MTHLSDDQLLHQLYGIVQHSHLESCEQCAARYRQLELRRAELAPPVEIQQETLAAQRRKIVARIENRPQVIWKWIPAMAAACVVAIGLMMYRPAAPVTPAPSHSEAADDQLFSEVYSMEQSTEPRAAAPIHALFEDNQ